MPATIAAKTVDRSAAMSEDAARIARSFVAAIDNRATFELPYRHWFIEAVFPDDVMRTLASLPFAAPTLDGVSGRRELHNDKRGYFDAAGMLRFPVMQAVAEALQSRAVTQAIGAAFEAPIDDTFLRLEYAQDIDGFWLEPHTDLGVKKFTCILYLSDGPGHDTLGTDIYWSKDRHFGRSPFRPGGAIVFVPSSDTWHGFEPRPIEGVRRSVILNYVTRDWRAREQLSFPDMPVRVS